MVHVFDWDVIAISKHDGIRVSKYEQSFLFNEVTDSLSVPEVEKMQIGKVPLSTTHPWGSCWPKFQIEVGSEFSKLVFLTSYKDLIFHLLENAIWISPLYIIFLPVRFPRCWKLPYASLHHVHFIKWRLFSSSWTVGYYKC